MFETVYDREPREQQDASDVADDACTYLCFIHKC